MKRLPVVLVSLSVLAVVAFSLLGSGDEEPREPQPASPSETPSLPDETTTTTPVDIPPLGLSFELPPPLEEYEAEGFVFIARSEEISSILSIAPDRPGHTDRYEPRPGESVEQIDLGAGEALVVMDAALAGLEPGTMANELLVSNGKRSFSLILSADQEILPALWDFFIPSLEVRGSP